MTAAPLRPIHLLRALSMALLALALAACATFGGGDADADTDVQAADSGDAAAPLELQQVMGDWYVIAHTPWFGERGRVASRITYAPDGADRVRMLRSWRLGFSQPVESDDAVARAREGTGNRVWTLRLLGVLPSKLRILEVADDNSWMLIRAEGRDHAWILSRTAVVGDEQYRELEDRIAAHGVNTDKLRRVAQVPEQADRLGFEPSELP